MDIVEKMATDIALAMDGGEWKDAKWHSKFHRDAWVKAVKPYANEIERLQGEVMAWWKETEIMRSDLAIYSEQIERQQKVLKEIADAKISGVIGDGYNVKSWLIKHHTILVDKARAALKEGV